MGANQVLVVDGSAVSRMVMLITLSTKPFRLRVACDGRQAVELAQQRPPDLILLGVSLPEISGLEVCRRLRQSLATCSVPIILVGRGGAEEPEAAFEAGCDDYICKPIDRRELLDKVCRHLERWGSRFAECLP